MVGVGAVAAADEMDDGDEDDGANDGHRKKADASVNDQAEMGEDGLTDHRTDQAEQNIDKDAVAASAHQFTGQPSGDKTGNDDSQHNELLGAGLKDDG